MVFNSLEFLFIGPIICLVYFIAPDKAKNIVLLLASYLLYIFAGWKHALILFLVTIITYIVAGLISKGVHEKFILTIGIILNVSVLMVCKYMFYVLGKIEKLKFMGNVFDWGGVFCEIIVPVGISFYTLQAIGYLIDVYKKKVSFESNFIIHALFLSFFPYAVSGPIERAGNMFRQFHEIHKFEYERVCHGLQLFLWGGAVKLILADRLAIFANELLSNPVKYVGWELIAGVFLYTLQIYCDFSSYSDMAVGLARVLGYDIIQNFNRPYFALSIAEFWNRWHISLSSWLRDYIYIPLGGNRKGQLRKYINLGIVFLISGVWHGAGWNYIFWGMLYVWYYIMAGLTRKLRNRMILIIHIDNNGWGICFIRRIITFSLVAFAWIFFYASDMNNAFSILHGIFTKNNIGILFSANGLNVGGMVGKDWMLLGIGFAILFLVDVLRENKIRICNIIDKQFILIRWITYIGLITAIIVFGIYGPEYEAQSFIYQAF